MKKPNLSFVEGGAKGIAVSLQWEAGKSNFG